MQKISVAEFEKKVEMEHDYLVYQERLKSDEARKQAVATVSAKFQKE